MSEEVLAALGRAGLKLQARKCEFGSGEMTYLGHRIGVEGVAPDPEKVEGIANFPKPSNVRSVRRFPFSCCDVLNCRNFDDFLSKQKLKNSYYSG